MIDPKQWAKHPDVVYETPNGALEDFAVVEILGDPLSYRAYFVAGASLQDQRLFCADGASPLGPFGEARPAGRSRAAHTRLYRSRFDANRRLVTAVWPGLPKAGLWLFEDVPGTPFEQKSLLVPPLPDTEFSVAVANPAVVHDGEGWNVYFEGRSKQMFWRVFQAAVSDDFERVSIVRAPVLDGANPFCARFGATWYLYASVWNHAKGGFDTHAWTQPEAARV